MCIRTIFETTRAWCLDRALPLWRLFILEPSNPPIDKNWVDNEEWKD
ncbi:hypothetical protein NVP1121O_173 [Vibrio phage 1.121.O._10N.286.46.C4]|nr:hypothetical protein NVP1121O_173 [Vibrio phage 1.121.O._10N.286.46.C4]